MSTKFLGGLAVLSLAITPLAAVAAGIDTLFSAEQEACFGRIYDSKHLTDHPLQKVTSIHIYRSLDDRKEAENWEPQRRAEVIRLFKEEHRVGVDAYVTFRDRKGHFFNSLSCSDEADGVRCGIDCDGGSFVLKPENAGSLLLHNNGFVLVGGCGEDVEATETIQFSPGKDDKVFRLEKKPVAVCKAEEQKAVPVRLGQGKPLRERWTPDEPFCYGRDYDAAHLAKHPQQKVASIRVGRLDPSQERKADNTSIATDWPGDVRLAVSFKLKSNAASRALRYACNPEVAGWRCSIRGEESLNETCTQRYFYLTRAAGDDVLLLNRKDGLPIAFMCPDDRKLDNAGNDWAARKTRSDDQTFKLSKMPLAACR